jgi:Mrp family chromosome partitioning ATPase
MTQTLTNAQMPPRAQLNPAAQEAYHGLWAALFYSGKPIGRTVMFVAAAAGEGVTTTACGLALAGSVPAGSSRVALVDFNFRHPDLHDVLGLKAGPGIGEILREGLAPDAAMQPVCQGLDFYPMGRVGRRVGDVLRSQAVVELLTTLSGGYDHVLVDVAPVNQYPDAAVLASIIKDVVLVARTDQTPREAVWQARKRIEAAGAKVAGLVMNMRTYPIPAFLYHRV